MNEILSYLNQLNYNWFQKKLENFLGEAFYNPQVDKIVIRLNDTQWAYSGEEEIKLNETIALDIDIVEYCWNDYFPTSIRYIKEDDEGLPINGSMIAENIIQQIVSLTKQVTDVLAIHTINSNAIEIIDNWKQNVLSTNQGEVYEKVLNGFFNHINQDISGKFRNINTVYDLIAKYDNPIKFELNQEELGSLILILYRSNFFYESTPGDTSFITACIQHLYFKHNKTGLFTKATQLRNKFNDAKNYASFKARDKIIDKLRETFEQF